MRRIVGIVIFALGLLLIVAGFTRAVPGVQGIGILAAVIGLAVFGLSFIRRPEPAADAPPPLPPAERITGVFYEPDPVFKNLRHHPRWLAAFLVIAFFSLTYHIAFTQRVTPQRIAAETADKVIEGGWVPADQAAAHRAQQIAFAGTPVSRISAAAATVGWAFIGMLVLAGLYQLCVLAFGGRINFWQSLSVATYGWLPSAVVATVLNLILLYVKPADDIDVFKGAQGLARADLGLLFNPAAHPLLYVMGSFVGVFTLYRWWVTVSGLRNTATKISTGSAWGIAFLLWLVGLVFALILAAVFPQFVS